MSSKWSSDDEEKPSGGHQSPITPFSPPSEQKQGGEKRPRRPRLGCGEVSAEDMKNEDTEKPPAIVRTITGGWGLDVEGSAAPRDAESKCGLTKIGTTEGKRTGHGRRNHFDNEETEILIIPDLEDDGKEDITSKVAAAPKNATRRVPTLRELDEDLKYSVPSAVDGLDMSLLTRTLVPPEMLEGDDTPWDFDSLLQIVIQEYNAEKITGATGVGGAAEVQDSTGSTSSGSRSARSSRTVVA